MTSRPDGQPARDERRWTLWRSAWSRAWSVLPPGAGVPLGADCVAGAVPAEWKQRALDAEAALAAARQVDEAAITLIVAFKDVAEEARGHYGIEECAGPGQPGTEWDEIQGALASLARQAAALLAALNAPDDCPGCGAPHGKPPAGPCKAHGTPEAVARNAPEPEGER